MESALPDGRGARGTGRQEASDTLVSEASQRGRAPLLEAAVIRGFVLANGIAQ
jgi:hypothetical protein